MARKRKNGDGTIRQRADGRWEGRYVVGYDDKGYEASYLRRNKQRKAL